MALTKVSRGLLSTGIVDNSNATAITIGSDESVTLAGALTVDTNTLVVDAANNRVGIGTSSPASLIDATGAPQATSGSIVRVRNTSATSSNTSFGGVLFTSSPGTDFSIGKSNVNAATSLSFRNGNTGASLMELTSAGNVGISTSDPKSALEVKGTFGAPATSGSAAGFISRFSQTSGVGSLDVGFGDPYSWLQSRASNNYATNFDLVLQPNGGNVGIGGGASISPDADADNLVIQENGAAGITIGSSASSVGSIRFADSGSPRAGMIYYNHVGNEMRFYTNANERMRLTGGGSVQVKGPETNYISSSEYHQFAANIASIAMYVFNRNTSNGAAGILINVGNELSNSNGYFLRGYSNSTTRDNIYIYTNGDVSNRNGTYSQFSDVKLKQDISDANNQWQDFKSIQFRKYRFKDDVASDENAPYHLGVVAQELEAAGLNGLVTESPDKEFYESPVTDDDGNAVLDEDGNAVTEQEERLTGETTKSVKMSILYAKGMVALQEAMARIETLEAKVQELENN